MLRDTDLLEKKVNKRNGIGRGKFGKRKKKLKLLKFKLKIGLKPIK